MRGEDAYAVLGLRPGAGRAEIDQAYRRLIKRYHPDFAGGDAGRAAELNGAYSALRARTREPQLAAAASPGGEPRRIYARPRSRWRGLAFAAAGMIAAVLVARSTAMVDPRSSRPQFSSASAALAASERRAAKAPRAVFDLDEPLATVLIDGSVADAIRLHAAGDSAPAVEFSRDCLSRMSASPSLPLFDSCAAYDEAIAVLGAGNPAFESGPFNPSAVTARQVGAARLLSADYFEAESRLQRIRSRVHMVLLPQLPDVRQAAAMHATAPVAVPELAEARVVTEAVAPPAQPPRRASPARADRQRRAAPAASVRTGSTAPRQAEAQPAPASQQPVPAWQRPLPNR